MNPKRFVKGPTGSGRALSQWNRPGPDSKDALEVGKMV